MGYYDDLDDHPAPDSPEDGQEEQAGAQWPGDFEHGAGDDYAAHGEITPEAASVFEQLKALSGPGPEVWAGGGGAEDEEEVDFAAGGHAPDDRHGPAPHDDASAHHDDAGRQHASDEEAEAGAPSAPAPGHNGYVREYHENWTPDQFDGLGDPFTSSAFHHYQGQEPTCAIMAQLSVLQNLTGLNVPGEQAVNLATYAGWYHDGTPPQHAGSILEHFGVRTEQKYDATLGDIADALARGDRVIVNVNAAEVRTPLRDAATNVPVNQSGGGHALWVTGIDPQPDGTWKVIVCDSAYQDGGLKAIDAADFLNAWQDHRNFMLTAHPPSNMRPFA